MAGLELRFLGDFEVCREGHAMPLPPSKKTRALLAYLCLQPRRFSRDYLCQLLWERPDDPRGSLRWSLSKIRSLLDDDHTARVQADRNNVGIVLQGLAIDILQLRHMVQGGLTGLPTDALEAAAAQWRGNVLEGLEFSSFHDFHAWCVAEREQSLRDRTELLGELARRLADDPTRALPHVRSLVGLSPYDEGHRATLIRLLIAARQFAEAEEQFQLGLRMLKEAGVAASGALVAARRPPRIDAPPLREQPTLETVALVRPAPAAGLYGRETELATLESALGEVRLHSRCAMLLLSGAPGMGKSSLLAAARQHAVEQGALLLQAAAFEADSIRPFALWLDALRALDPALHDRVFGDVDVANRDRLFSRLSDWIAQAAATRPVVLLFDDVQWCDES
ncbi:MAG TPA: AAA family ATPase, partial [Methylibium sp.]